MLAVPFRGKKGQKKFCHGFSQSGVFPIEVHSERGVLMNVDQAALKETDNLRPAVTNPVSDNPVRLKIAERPDRDRIQRVVDLADALLSEAETLARDQALRGEEPRLNPWAFLEESAFTTKY